MSQPGVTLQETTKRGVWLISSLLRSKGIESCDFFFASQCYIVILLFDWDFVMIAQQSELKES